MLNIVESRGLLHGQIKNVLQLEPSVFQAPSGKNVKVTRRVLSLTSFQDLFKDLYYFFN